MIRLFKMEVSGGVTKIHGKQEGGIGSEENQ